MVDTAVGGFNIATFKSHIEQRGIARTNKFIIRITPPLLNTTGNPSTGFGGSVSNTPFEAVGNDLEFWCDGVSIPGVALSMRQLLRYGYGPSEKKPISPVFNDINFSFINDGASQNLMLFHQWIEFINKFDFRQGMGGTNPSAGPFQTPGALGFNANYADAPTVFELRYKVDYAGIVNILQFNDSGAQTLNIVLREAWPTNVGDLQMNWADNNNVQRVPVTFTFHDWYNQDLADTT